MKSVLQPTQGSCRRFKVVLTVERSQPALAKVLIRGRDELPLCLFGLTRWLGVLTQGHASGEGWEERCRVGTPGRGTYAARQWCEHSTTS